MMMNRDVLSWDEYFMSISHLSGMRSKDPNTQVGACIVNDNNRIVGIGYNGLPHGMRDDEFSWKRDGDYLDTKYPFVVHAELNAIFNSTTSLDNCSIYVTLFPCNECAKAIIQSGIKEVIYESDKYLGSDSNIASKMMMRKAGVRFKKIDKDIKVSVN